MANKEVKNMTNYEVLFIIDPALEDEKKEAITEALSSAISLVS